MSKDYIKIDNIWRNVRDKVLQNINCTLESMGKNINDYALVDYKSW